MHGKENHNQMTGDVFWNMFCIIGKEKQSALKSIY